MARWVEATADPGRPLLVLEGAGRSYRGSPPVRAVKPTSLSICRNDFVSLMGRSGSGKSTLLNLMGLLDRPSAGSLVFAGIDTREMPDRCISRLRARNIGFVFQSFNLIPHRTATENVALGLLYQQVPLSQRWSLALQALDRVGIAHRARALPGQMSGGEQQRVAIARAVVGRPGLLLCDEPTGNLDESTSRPVLDLIASLHGDGIAVVVVTHDPGVAARASRHLVMADGVVREGSSRAGLDPERA